MGMGNKWAEWTETLVWDIGLQKWIFTMELGADSHEAAFSIDEPTETAMLSFTGYVDWCAYGAEQTGLPLAWGVSTPYIVTVWTFETFNPGWPIADFTF